MLGFWTSASGAENWTDLLDTPASITALGFVRGNAGGTALEFAPIADTTLQEAYDASTSPEIVVDATNGALTIKDAATPIAANLFEVMDNSPAALFAVDVDQATFAFDYADNDTAGLTTYATIGEFDRINLFPDTGVTLTAAVPQPMIDFVGEMDSAQASCVFPSFIETHGVFHADATTSPFRAWSCLFSLTRLEADSAVTLGPAYVFIDNITTRADGATVGVTQHRSFVSQPVYETAGGGTLNVTNHYGMVHQGAIGSGVAVTNWIDDWHAAKTVTGGAVTSWVGTKYDDPGVGTFRSCILSTLNGTIFRAFLNHIGTAPSFHAGDFLMTKDNIFTYYGAGNDARISYNGTNLVIDPDFVGSGRVLIGATGDDDMLLNDIEIDGDLNHDGTNIGFYGTAPVAKPTVTGSRAGNAALASLLTSLAGQGLLTDSSTA